jgi:hypothetical protein
MLVKQMSMFHAIYIMLPPLHIAQIGYVKLTLGGTIMQLLTHNPKVEGSNTAIGPEIEKINKKAFKMAAFKMFFSVVPSTIK